MPTLTVSFILELMTFSGVMISVNGQHQYRPRQQIMYAAENRALQGFAYARRPVRSRVICGRDCSMDERCKSFNFNDCNKMCELNFATRDRQERPEDFNATRMSVYFDTEGDTPLYSLTDISLDRYRSCKMFYNAGYHSSGIYTIYPEGFGADGLRVYCDMVTDGGGWIVFQRRQDGSVDFYRNWTEYQSGFGDLSGEFWLGNDNLVTLTSDASGGTWELRVDLGDWENNTAWSKYSDFQISPGEFNIKWVKFDSDSPGGNALPFSLGDPFTTKDRDNDADPSSNCAEKLKGAWWFDRCGHSNLNGLYYPGPTVENRHGLYWQHWKLSQTYSLKKCSMKFRERHEYVRCAFPEEAKPTP